MILEAISVGSMEVNCYILAEKENSSAIIIDPGAQAMKIRKILIQYKLAPAFIINTHGHFDHIGADNDFDVPVYVHKMDAPLLKDPMLNLSGLFALPYSVKSEIRLLEDGQKIKLDTIELEVMHVPGHTAGGLALKMLQPQKDLLFTGDTLFCRGVGRSDLAGGDETALMNSIKNRFFTLPDNTRIYPGHGPSSTIGEEKENNLI